MTNTPRLQLDKPANDGSDNVDVAADLNANYDIIDQNIALRVCTSATKPASPFQGQLIYETDTTIPRFYTGTKWFDLRERVVRKNATESIASSTTLQDDDALTLAVNANDDYLVDIVLRYQAATAADLKCQLVGPASCTFKGALHRLGNGAAAITEDLISDLEQSTDFTPGGIGSTTPVVCHIKGTLVVEGTAGVFKLQWAQLTSNATATDMLFGSFMSLKQYN